MAYSLNKCQIIGNLGKDPEMRYTQDGKPIASLSIATSESWTDKQGQKQERTEWHRVSIFGKLAEIVQQYAHKGSKVYIEGKLQTKKWTDQQGQDRYTTEIILSGFQSQFIILDSKPQNGGQQPHGNHGGNGQNYQPYQGQSGQQGGYGQPNNQGQPPPQGQQGQCGQCGSATGQPHRQGCPTVTGKQPQQPQQQQTKTVEPAFNDDIPF